MVNINKITIPSAPRTNGDEESMTKILDVCVDLYIPQLSNNKLFKTRRFSPHLAKEAYTSYNNGSKTELLEFDDLHLAAATFLGDRATAPTDGLIKEDGSVLGYMGG